jgi:hypothetical protein
MKQETLEEAAERILANNIDGLRDALQDDDLFFFYKGVIQCYGEAMVEWQAERMYSEEDLREAFSGGRTVYNYKSEWEETYSDNMTSSKFENFDKWFKQFKKK